MTFTEKLINKEEYISVIGLGYVGLSMAVAFSKKGINVVGFDTNKAKVDLYNNGIDPTHEVGDDEIKNTEIEFTLEEASLRKAKFHIIAVPTPINDDHTPNLSCVINATKTIGRNLTKGSVVVYESTVYPGVTEDICIPILEKESSLKCGIDFKVGYSPERINPGDKIHRLENITKIVSATDSEGLDIIKTVYDLIIEAGTYSVSSIKTAEAIKVVENSQRDINIAFMNELAMVFDRMNIDTDEVVNGMNTKWNALGFKPGLVGGHCIGIDPYYFTYEAERLGYHSQIILNGRIVNDNIGKYIAESTIKEMVKSGLTPINANVVVLGLTFKENCNDIRNSKVYDIIKHLNEYGVYPDVVDPLADKDDVKASYGILLKNLSEIKNVDCVIIAVAHDIFKSSGLEYVKSLYKDNIEDNKKILIDVKSMFPLSETKESGLRYWRL